MSYAVQAPDGNVGAPVAIGFDPARARDDFPILGNPVHDRPLVYLDTAASAQKPRAVIDAVRACYETEYANVHRGVYWLSERATEAYEGTREKARALINGAEAREIVFVRGATEGINLVAASFGQAFLEAGDEVVITHMEHHSNIVPWQMLRDRIGIVLKVAPIDDNGALILDGFVDLLGPRTRLAAFPHVANALGTLLPVEDMCRIAREKGVRTLIDGCQAAPHIPVDAQALGCDFYVFSGHKLYGPSGIGVLWGRAELLDAMPPWQGGGDMIRAVTFEETTYAETPHKFEAGTPNIAGVVGLGAAIDYLTGFGLDAIAAHEADLLGYATRRLTQFPDLRLIGTAPTKSGVISFVLDGVHPHDIATILDQQGVAVRAGHHCAQPVMERFGVTATVRASLGLYNSRDDIDGLTAGLDRVREI
ncbi:MAG: cysteine desulfurase, partial [Alphaproteobacteria bacterium]|nr:cysteine desulfurase [Alphaproteobacteria bacterium]